MFDFSQRPKGIWAVGSKPGVVLLVVVGQCRRRCRHRRC